jgi:hypothetical protein
VIRVPAGKADSSFGERSISADQMNGLTLPFILATGKQTYSACIKG